MLPTWRIAEAVTRPAMRFVAGKTAEQQAAARENRGRGAPGPLALMNSADRIPNHLNAHEAPGPRGFAQCPRPLLADRRTQAGAVCVHRRGSSGDLFKALGRRELIARHPCGSRL